MFCDRCGNQVNDEWIFCDRCGNRLQEEQKPVPKPAIPKKSVMARPGIKLRIVALGNDEPGRAQEFNLSAKLIIGRVKPGSDITFEDREISAKHCEIFREKGMVLVNDLNSKNGTFVNGVPISERRRLSSGDVLLIGRTEIRIIFDETL